MTKIVTLIALFFSSQVFAAAPIPPLNAVIPKWIQSKIDIQRKMKNATNKGVDTTGLPQSVDMRHFDTQVKSQFGGTCTTFGLMAAMENFIVQAQKLAPAQVDLSERHFWSLYEQYNVDVAIATAQKNYITEEAYWPQDRTSPLADYKLHAGTKLLKVNFINDDVNKALKALAAGHPIYIGSSVTTSFANCDKEMSVTSAATGGGHAIAVVGYKLDPKVVGGGYFLIKNSWGNDCGDKGYQYYPFNYCLRDDMYCTMWEISGVETTFGEQKPVVITDDSFMVKKEVAKSWWSRTRYITLNIASGVREMQQVVGVSYNGEAVLAPYTWKKTTQKLPLMITVVIKFKDGKTITKVVNIE